MFRPIRPIILCFAAVALVGALAGCNEAPDAKKVPPPAASAPPFVAVLPPPPVAAGVSSSETAKDSTATDPKGILSKDEESKSMPMAGQGNNHSSPSLEPPKK